VNKTTFIIILHIMCISIDHSDSQQVSIYLAILASAHVTRNSKMADEKQILDK